MLEIAGGIVLAILFLMYLPTILVLAGAIVELIFGGLVNFLSPTPEPEPEFEPAIKKTISETIIDILDTIWFAITSTVKRVFVMLVLAVTLIVIFVPYSQVEELLNSTKSHVELLAPPLKDSTPQREYSSVNKTPANINKIPHIKDTYTSWMDALTGERDQAIAHHISAHYRYSASCSGRTSIWIINTLRTGKVLSIDMSQGSGNDACDREASIAIKNSSPLPIQMESLFAESMKFVFHFKPE